MASATNAVFLSYASQDAEAARRVCEALRSAGIEVWLDQSELRGGDAWDASIRKRINECGLFVPLISANTDARSEGYFRLEWKLAVDRSQRMADDQAFLLPVMIDDVAQATARVPDRFREVQWSRLAASDDPKALAERAHRLLFGAAPPAAATPMRGGAGAPLRPATCDQPSIAVLPFVNMSRDEENEYFADGLTEELLNVLAKIRGLRVASRTSAFYFKGKEMDLPAVAQKLNVATILEGSVRKSGKRVRITAQLIEVASDSHLWSETYDRDLDDIFAVQDDIAQSVVAELRSALMGERLEAASSEAKAEVRAAASGRAGSAEAHRLYLQARFFAERMTGAEVAKARTFVREALALDPEFALAWAFLGRIHVLQAGYGWSPVPEGFDGAREAAERAIALAPDAPEGHVCLGLVLQLHDWDWEAAQQRYDRALALSPGNADVMRSLGNLAGIRGRFDEALAWLRKAAALDPLSSNGHRLLGLRCAMYGHLDEAERAFRAVLELNPTAGLVHSFRSIVELFRGNAARALEFARQEVLPDFRLVSIALIEHSLGHAAEADRHKAELIEEHADAMAYQVAELLAWRGEIDEAFEWLERAYVQRDPGLVQMLGDPLLEPLRPDPRWRAMARKMRLA